MTVTLPFDVLVSLTPYLSVKSLLELACTCRALTEPLTKAAFRSALTIPTSGNAKPITYAIKNGDIPLLSSSLATLDRIYPDGWKWSGLYRNGFKGVMTLAAAHNLEALQLLNQRWPLMPAGWTEEIPAATIHHGMYTSSTGDGRFSSSLAEIANTDLVRCAIRAGNFDCAAYLLTDHAPNLFPNGLRLRADPVFYSSGLTLEFLLAHNAILPGKPLHVLLSSGDIPDPRVVDIILENGYQVDDQFLHEDRRTPLINACELFRANGVEHLLRAGAKVNGIDNSLRVTKIISTYGVQYFSSSPAVTLLLSGRWSPNLALMETHEFGDKFIRCFESLLRHGAELPINFLEILLFRIWVRIGQQIVRQPGMVLPNVPDKPKDQNKGVRSLLQALERAETLAPFDKICEVVSNASPEWRVAEQMTCKARLIKLLYELQDSYGHLPGPARLRDSMACALPEMYVVEERS